MTPITVAKFGGSALGLEGDMIPQIVDRIKQLQQESKVVTVFSAPLIEYNGKIISMTDMAIYVGRSYASSTPVEIEVLRETYERISSKYLDSAGRREFLDTLDKFYRQVIVSLKQAAENRRFVDVIRSRTLAYSGDVSMGGFIGKTVDGLETTYERGGSDRTAVDIAILLHDHYDVKIDFEKD